MKFEKNEKYKVIEGQPVFAVTTRAPGTKAGQVFETTTSTYLRLGTIVESKGNGMFMVAGQLGVIVPHSAPQKILKEFLKKYKKRISSGGTTILPPIATWMVTYLSV